MFVYAIEASDTKTAYVGMSKHPHSRWKDHVGRCDRPTHELLPVSVWLRERREKEPGWMPVLVILEELDAKDPAREKAWIDKYLADGWTLANVRLDGGTGFLPGNPSWSGKKRPEHGRLMSEQMKGKPPNNKGKPRTPARA